MEKHSVYGRLVTVIIQGLIKIIPPLLLVFASKN